MRARDHVSPRWLGLPILLALGALSCEVPPVATVPPPTTLTVTFTPAALAVTGLTLTTATMKLNHIQALGDTPPTSPPPQMTTETKRMDSLSLDVLGAGGSITLELPPGIYSRVGFDVDDVMLAGTWDGTPFTATLAMFQGPRVDLRASTPEEVDANTPDGGGAAFAVAVDPGSWFAAPSPLAGTMPGTDGTIMCTEQQNAAAADALTARLPPSFSLP